MFAAVVVLAVALWAVFAMTARTRWNSYIAALRTEPGIVVVSERRRWSGFEVGGLRDPLAVDPTALLAPAGIAPSDVTQRWQMYQALEPSLILQRARQLLRAPGSVTLQYSGGVLTAGGSAAPEWIVESQRIATLVPGVDRYDMTPLVDAEIRSRTQQLEAVPLLFVRGSTAFEAGSDAILEAHLERARALDMLGQATGKRYLLGITGHADSDGPPATNDVLSARRAEHVRAAFASLGLRQIELTAAGVGSSQPLHSNPLTEVDRRANRRVSLRLAPLGTPRGS